jgi:hypothetical protein
LTLAVVLLLVLAAGCAPLPPDAGRDLVDGELRAGSPVLERPEEERFAAYGDWSAAYDAARAEWERDHRAETRDQALEFLERLSADEIERLLRRETEPVFRCRALEILAALLAEDAARWERLRAVLSERLERCPLTDGERAKLAAWLEAVMPVPPVPGARLKVGCLLPLTGEYAAFGRRVLQGMMLALPVFPPPAAASGTDVAAEGPPVAGTGGGTTAAENDLTAAAAVIPPLPAAVPPTSPIAAAAPASASTAFGVVLPLELVIRDTAGNGERARDLARQLIEDEGVALLVGPVTGPAALQAAIEAEVHRVPIITLSPQPGLAARGEYVFQHCLTARNEARELALAAIGRLGLESLALLYPRTPFGEEFAQHFRAAVKEWGGRVVRSVAYAPDTSDFGPRIRALIGNDRYATFVRERRAFANWKREQEQQAKPKVAERQGKLRRLAAELGLEAGDLFAAEESLAVETERHPHPILKLDFTGLVVPDFQQRLRLIIPQLIFYDLAEVRFLGGRGWASPDLQEDAGEYLPGAVFVGPAIDLPPVGETPAAVYCRTYAAQYGEPASLDDAYGYDTLMLVARLLESSRDGESPGKSYGAGENLPSPECLAAALRGVRNMPLVTGSTTALADGELAKELLPQTRNERGEIVPVEAICTGCDGE